MLVKQKKGVILTATVHPVHRRRKGPIVGGAEVPVAVAEVDPR